MKATDRELQADLDRCAAMLEARVRERIQPEQQHDFEDWREYFREAQKHPNDQWIQTKAEQSLTRLMQFEQP